MADVLNSHGLQNVDYIVGNFNQTYKTNMRSL